MERMEAKRSGLMMNKLILKTVKLLIICSLMMGSGCITQLPTQISGPVPEFPIAQYPDEVKLLPKVPPHNFREAKKEAWKIFLNHPFSFYCNCKFNPTGQIQTGTCNYRPLKENTRTYKIEWEHIVPAQAFGSTRPCWKKKLCVDNIGNGYKGRACCAKIDKLFQKMEADLHNLVPAIGAINQARGTLTFGDIKEPVPLFMGCDLKISRIEKLVEPRVEIKGTIARAYLYMSSRYHIPLPYNQRLVYQKWHHRYPPTDWEMKWNTLVRDVQGNSNPYIEPLENEILEELRLGQE